MKQACEVSIGGRAVGPGHPVFVVAELSANHNRDYDEAVRLIRAAKDCGADAVKLQTYTPDTMTLDAAGEHFTIGGTLWSGERLHDLYRRAATPWEWQPKLKAVADEAGILLFSSPFDRTAVDFLEAEVGVPAYKIASFELVDHGLIAHAAATGRPLILSTGMATLAEIDEAVSAARAAGAREIVLLKCTSAYPADPADMNLRTIPHLAEAFQTVVGLSDHAPGIAAAVAAVALGAALIEKHFTLGRDRGGPDAPFSLEPAELRTLVAAVRDAERALGAVRYGRSEAEVASLIFRRSLFVVEAVGAGEALTARNVRAIRPGSGLAPKFLPDVLGRRAARDLPRGTPLHWSDIA